MTYSISVEYRYFDTMYKNSINTWDEVLSILRHGLKGFPTVVRITKYSSDNKVLKDLYVSMANLYEVATSETDKVLSQ